MIEKIINIVEKATELPVKPLIADTSKECILYNWTVFSDDGVKCQNRLELRIITKTVAKAEEAKQRIIESLVNFGDRMEIEDIYNCDVNGGGQVFEYDTEMIHTYIYFSILTRSYKWLKRKDTF